MSIVNQPDNLNFLSPNGFRFTISKIPNVSYFVQSVTLPDVGLNPLEFANPFTRVQVAGAKLYYSPLELRFTVDEDMTNYLEIYRWLEEIGFPETYDQYTPEYQVDGTLTIMSSHKNPNLEVKFRDMFPISLSNLTFNSTDTGVNYLEATVTFRYTLFNITKL